jgi:hypothetical protein
MSDAKYGPQTREFLKTTGADIVLTVVIGGASGSGLATASRRPGAITPLTMATMLRTLADEFDRANARGESFDVTVKPL